MKRIVLVGLVALVGTQVGCKPPEPEPPVAPTPATILSFTASPAQAEPGETVVLTWETENASHHTLRRRDGSAVALDEPARARGTLDVTVEADEVFLLTARGEGGSDSAAAAVAVITREERAPLFTVIPDHAPAGAPVSLVWSLTGEGAITIEDSTGQTVYAGEDRASSRVVRPTQDVGYTLRADGQTLTVQVTVQPVIVAFASAKPAVYAEDEITLQWSVLGAETVSLTSQGRGELLRQVDPVSMADGSFTEAAPVVAAQDGLVRYRLEAQAHGRSFFATVEVGVGVDPVFVANGIPEFAREGGSYSLSWQTARADRLEVVVAGQVLHVAQTPAEVAQGQFLMTSPVGSHELTLRATNARGGAAQQTATVNAVGAPVLVSFDASPSPLMQGGAPVTLSWEVTNARRVRISEQGGALLRTVTGLGAETGSVEVYPNKQTVYVLEADNLVGDPISPELETVDVTQPVGLVFSPNSVPAGAPIQITGTNPPLFGELRMPGAVFKNPSGTSFVDIKGNGGTALPVVSGDDTISFLADLGEVFTTQVMDTPISSSTVNVSMNGWMSFSSAVVTGPFVPSSTLPDTTLPHLAIVPFGDDLQADSSSGIFWRLDGQGPDRRLIVQWDDVHPWLGSTKRATFQAQVYASGRVVFAYKSITGFISTDLVSIGVQNHDSTQALAVPASMLPNVQPAAGDRFSIGGEVTFPVDIIATPTPVTLELEVAPGMWMTITDSPAIIPAGQFAISEVNYNPAFGQPEWFEVVNNTADPIDLQGWAIDFGGGNTHTIASSVVLPPNGYRVLGQSSNVTASVTADYVYGTAYEMPDASGSVSLGIAGAVYATMNWTAAGTAGASLQRGIAQPELMLASGSTNLLCESLGAPDANGTVGTPGAPNGKCFPYALGPAAPNGFESILTSGAAISGLSDTADSAVGTLALPRPVRIFGALRSTLYVSSNGFIALTSPADSATTNNPTVATTSPNGVLAPFWDDLIGQSGTNTNGQPCGIRWQQFDPDGTPASGDEYTLVSWENWKIWTSSAGVNSVNFQVKFLEATGDIEFHYGTMSSNGSSPALVNGSSATTWLENGTGTAALVYNVNSATSPGIAPDSGIRFSYAP